MQLTRRTFVSTSFAALVAAGGFSATLFASEAHGDEKAPQEDGASEDTAETEGADSLQTEFPITIEHAFGTTTIESRPERVVCLQWNNMEPPLALGIAPVGYSRPNYGALDGNGTWTWVSEAYEELGAEQPVLFDDTDGFDLEAINDCKPDIILCAYSGITQEDYDALTAIAPVVPHLGIAWQTFWREQTMVEGTALGMAVEAQQLVDETDQLIADKIEEYGTSGHKGAVIMTGADDPSTFYIYLPTDPRGAYLIDLGIELPDSVKALAESEPEDSIALTLSSEQADQFADLEIAVMYGDEALLEQLQADPLLSAIPAIAKGACVMLPLDSMLGAACNPSVLAIQATIDEYMGLIAEAIEKAEA